MPTAREYTAMARRMDERADQLEQLPLRFVTGLTPAIGAGPSVDIVDQTFQVSAQHLARSAVVLRNTAMICRRRAAACRSYTDAIDRYRVAVAAGDPTVERPSRQPWMEYGP